MPEAQGRAPGRRPCAAGAVALALLLLTACGGEAPRPRAEPAPPAGERLRLVPVAVPDTVEVPATVTTEDMAEARARIPGLLVALSVREGDRVSAGQRIGLVSDTRLAADRAALASAAAAAEAQAARARADLERIRFLHREGVYAQARLDAALAEARAAEAQARAARAQEAAVAAVSAQGAVLAPSAGRVLRTDVPAGSAVAPGTPIAVITSGAPVLRLEVPESIGRRLAPGQAVAVDGLPGRPSDRPAAGRIRRIYPAVAGGRVTADATLDGLDQALVGARVTARVTLGDREALAVPARFVSARFGLRFARVLSADGTAALEVPVDVRPVPGTDRLEILSGLRRGDVLLAPAPARDRPA